MTKRTPYQRRVKTVIKPGSIGHSLLCFAKMKKGKPFSPQNVLYVLAGRFTTTYSVRRCAEGLVREGLLITENEDLWSITEKGNLALYELSEMQKSIPFSKKYPGVKKDPILDGTD